MGLDETLFGAVYREVRALFRRRREATELRGAVDLEPLTPKLAVLASAMAGRRLQVRPAEGLGGVVGDEVRLPMRLAIATDPEINAEAYVVRAILSGVLARESIHLPSSATAPWERTLATALAMARARRVADEELAGFSALARPFHAALEARGAWPDSPAERAAEQMLRDVLGGTSARSSSELDAAKQELLALGRVSHLAPVPLFGELLPAPAAKTPARTRAPKTTRRSLAQGTQRQGRPRDSVERVELAQDPLAENPLTHSFEKVHTVEEYRGGTKRMDGADELDAHGEALDEIDMRQVIRTSQGAHSVYRADAAIEDLAGETDDEPEDGGHYYPEWDGGKNVYRPEFCCVHVTSPTARGARGSAEVRAIRHSKRRTIEELRRRFAAIEATRRPRMRQLDGPDLDLDAIVQWKAELRAGAVGEPRLHASRRPHAKDVAFLVLLDASMSTDGWVDDRRVIDVEREAIVVLGEALAGLDISIAVAAFASHTRRDCRFLALKGFHERWDASVGRLFGVEPDGYTRIGPALRHATSILSARPERHRVLVLLSDGKPTDYDRYEGAYGVADVRQATREAEAARIRVLTLAVDKSAKSHLGAMFGRGRWAILPRTSALPLALGGLTAGFLR